MRFTANTARAVSAVVALSQLQYIIIKFRLVAVKDKKGVVEQRINARDAF